MLKLGVATALAAGVAGCGQGESGNVMAPSANALSQEQVDLALGPEAAGEAGSALETTNGANRVDTVRAEEQAVTTRAANRVDSAPADDSADEIADDAIDEAPSDNDVAED